MFIVSDPLTGEDLHVESLSGYVSKIATRIVSSGRPATRQELAEADRLRAAGVTKPVRFELAVGKPTVRIDLG
jgi:hypothetical protein